MQGLWSKLLKAKLILADMFDKFKPIEGETMTTVLQTAFSRTFFKMKFIPCLFPFLCYRFLIAQLKTSYHWYRHRLSPAWVTSDCLNQLPHSSVTYIRVTRLQWVNHRLKLNVHYWISVSGSRYSPVCDSIFSSKRRFSYCCLVLAHIVISIKCEIDKALRFCWIIIMRWRLLIPMDIGISLFNFRCLILNQT